MCPIWESGIGWMDKSMAQREVPEKSAHSSLLLCNLAELKFAQDYFLPVRFEAQ